MAAFPLRRLISYDRLANKGTHTGQLRKFIKRKSTLLRGSLSGQAKMATARAESRGDCSYEGGVRGFL